MATKNIEIQDSDGNIYYPHTNASVVKNGSTTVAEQMKDIANDSYPIVEATGTNTYIGSTARITKLSKGTRCTLFIGNNSNGNCSLNLNNYGVKNIKDSFGNIVTNLKANIPYNLCYNGSDFILQGKGGGGNATADKLLSGSTATVDSGPITGTMTNQGSKTASLNCGGSYIIPTGYHNGSGKVTANSLASQTPGNATASQILSGFSAWVNGNKVNGNASIQSLGGIKITMQQFTFLNKEEIYKKHSVNLGYTPKTVYMITKSRSNGSILNKSYINTWEFLPLQDGISRYEYIRTEGEAPQFCRASYTFESIIKHEFSDSLIELTLNGFDFISTSYNPIDITCYVLG